MRVNIDEIKEVGLRRSWDLAREDLDEIVRGHPAGHRARGPMHIEGDFKKVERRVLFDARGRAELTAPCGRCLKPVAVDAGFEFEITYVPEEIVAARPARDDEPDERHGRGSSHVAGSFRDKDADEETYAGKVIDVDPVVREQLLLALPSYPVCEESCKGLCPVCGANLNERDCGCDRRVPDPRWAGLEKLKQKSKEE